MTSDSLFLRYQIAQMLLCGFDGISITPQDDIFKAISQQGLGGVILFDKNFQHPDERKNIVNPQQLTRLIHQLRTSANNLITSHNRKTMPLFIAVDYEGGAVNRLKAEYGFPAMISAAQFAKLDEVNAQQVADLMAQTLIELGFNLNFAPLVDLNINPDNPIIGKLGRSFSANPQIVIKNAYIIANALHHQGILFTYKHFPGHGSSATDSHLEFVDVSDTWQREELLPYIELFKRNIACPAIMVGHIINRQLDPSSLPASLSYAMLTTLLRQQLHYQGLIIADDLQMKAISQYYTSEEAMVMAINAGCDILIFGNQLTTHPQAIPELIELIYHNVITGHIPIANITQAFKRISRIKAQLPR